MHRLERISQLLKEEINEIIVLKKVKDPRISSRVSVLHVKISKDLSFATVFISSFMSDSTLDKTVAALNHAKGYIQSLLSKKHKWKNTPKLTFKKSDGFIKGEEIFRTLEQYSSPHDKLQ